MEEPGAETASLMLLLVCVHLRHEPGRMLSSLLAHCVLNPALDSLQIGSPYGLFRVLLSNS